MAAPEPTGGRGGPPRSAGARGGSRLRKAAAPAGLFLGALVVAGLLAEGLVVIAADPQVRFPRRVVEAPWGLRYNEPGTTYTHRSADGEWEFRINRQGMRADRDYAYDKPPGVRRILSLGDSYTIGYEVEVEQTFSSVLERELRSAGVDAVVMNAGVSGYSTAEAALYLERELLSYDPDLVVLSFYGNDLVDNVRTGLFSLNDEGRATPAADRYIPAGRLGNWLNRNPVFNALSARSNAFALLKERLTLALKRSMVEANEAHLNRATAGDSAAPAEPGSGVGSTDAAEERAQRQLAAAIIHRMHDTLSARGVPLIVQSIPVRVTAPALRLVDGLPYDQLGHPGPGLHLLPAASFLGPHLGRTPLYHDRSHFHWTPFAHRRSGEALARLILDEGLLPDD